MFSIKTDVKGYIKKMDKISKELLPKAIVATVNTAARGSHARAIKNIEKDFTLRNEYTRESLMIWQSKYKKGRSIDRINAQVGSISPYLPIQETGGVIRAKRRRIPVPTVFSRGGSKRSVIQKRFRLRAMGQVAGFKQQYTKKGNKRRGKGFFFLPGKGGHKPGIFIRRAGGMQLRMVRDLSLRSYRLRPTRWHSKAVEYFSKRSTMERIFIHHAEKLLKGVK